MDDFPLGLACKHCGEVFGMIFTPITPKTTPLISACTKCVTTAMEGRPAATAAEWDEVLKKL
jgi:hypothetical protein